MILDHDALAARADELRHQYRQAWPYPHLIFDGLLVPETARAIEAAFPSGDHSDDSWTHYKHYNNHTLGLTRRDLFPAPIGEVVDELNSPRFTALLSAITGVPRLLADDMLEGGGLHMTEAGGYLNLHADFTNHHHHRNWQRRCNLILFLNSNWDEGWGGQLELWARDLSACGAKVPVRNNVAVLFETSRDTFHGYPDKLTCPPGMARKTLALYYYTQERIVDARATNYRARPGESAARRTLIAADRIALRWYTVAKERFGLSDRFASRLLRWLRPGRRS